ncbi:PaaI family thioesterase [Sneathiella glossodoripedis]|uniref:PaaI family thioesterase n=1 Tax=Sneathiella glossodoripedis TaxID=418853 RepID=UPI00046F6BE0|nr:PaaI family thioesterase [Sneathiella glossodoripedis]
MTKRTMKNMGKDNNSIPDGFEEVHGHAAFATRNGPYFEKIDTENRLIRGFLADRRHLNGVNFVHGGMLMSFADSSLARTINHVTGKRGVTLKMSSEFLRPVKEGDFVEAYCEVTRDTRTLGFVRGILKVGGHPVFRTDAIFQYIRPEKFSERSKAG